MKRYLLSITFLFAFVGFLKSQSSKTDSIFSKFDLKYSQEALIQAKLEYEQANDTVKAIMRRVYSLPMSSRKELVENYVDRSQQIKDLVKFFNKNVPRGYEVSIEIDMDEGPLRYIKSVDMQIFNKEDGKTLDLLKAEWGMSYGSETLASMLSLIDWTPMTFSDLKNLMQLTNCISIHNTDDYTEVGFKRSGLGKYSYLIFNKKRLSNEQLLEYNNRCEYMYYKDNVVLHYEGGMAGPQCFTD